MSTGSGNRRDLKLVLPVSAAPKASPKTSPKTSPRSARTDHRSFVPQRIDASIQARYQYNAGKDRIGEGGFGKVFVARDRQVPDRKVAIKRFQLGKDDAKNKVFRREVLLMTELDHPNICKILETYEQSPSQWSWWSPLEQTTFVYLVMEYCEGGDAFDRLRDLGKISEGTTANIIQQTVSALSYAHSKGIAHRDLKPENLCFSSCDPSDLHVTVIDWGLGFVFRAARMTYAVGSTMYTAPEVMCPASTGHYSQACDVWSLGVVTYVMLSGKMPFLGNDRNMRRSMGKDVRFPSIPWNHITDHCKDFVESCLTRAPECRPTMDELLRSPWLSTVGNNLKPEIAAQVLANMRQFGQADQFFSACTAAVARNLDHKNLKDIHQVFCDLDTNGDGVLDFCEIKVGFEKIYGANSVEVREIDDLFQALDLDGSGAIDYTEFCAAGIGMQTSMQEDVLWAAFKTFDVEEDGKIKRREIEKVLCQPNVSDAWSKELIDDVMEELKKYDKDGDGQIDFNEWLSYMRDKSKLHRRAYNVAGTREMELAHEGREFELSLKLDDAYLNSQQDEAYELLTEMRTPSPKKMPIMGKDFGEQYEDKTSRPCCGDVSDLCVIS